MQNLNIVKVLVFDFNNQPITNAEVKISAKNVSEGLGFDKDLHAYVTGRLKADRYLISVTAKGFEKQTRSVFIAPTGAEELFILGKKGMPFYYRDKVKVPFEPIRNLLGVAVQAPENDKIIEPILTLAKRNGLEQIRTHKNYRRSGLFVFSYPKELPENERQKLVAGIKKRRGVLTAGPILRQSEKHASLLTDEIIVRFKGGIEEKTVRELAERFDLRILRSVPYAGNTYHFQVGKNDNYESLNVCAKLVEMDVVDYAEPNLFHTSEDDAIVPTNFLFPEQWDHTIINTPDAWQVLSDSLGFGQRFGSPDVTVAVVDTGVNTNHAQFSGNVSNGQPKVFTAFDFSNMFPNNNSLAGSHGTCCASGSVGFTNVSSVGGDPDGSVGIAGNCRLIAIRRGGTEVDYSDMYIWAGGFDPNSVRAGFPAQLTKGADVISNSFGYGGSIGNPISGLMRDTFDYLTTYGRSGKGVLLFFSAGNANTQLDVTFARPWGMYGKCMSVTASTLANDGMAEVKAGYSSFGSMVSFCAPSNDGSPHNPPTGYGAWTATVLHDGRFTQLSAAANSGDTSISVTSLGSMGGGDFVVLENFGTANSEINIVNPAVPLSNPVSLSSGLNNNHVNGTPIRYSDGNAPRNRQSQTTLSAAANAGNTSVTVASAAGMVNGQAIFIGNPSANISPSEAKTITGISGNTISFTPALFSNKANGTAVIFGNRDYRNDFGGTSYATPVCAGAAALMLSANNKLTWIEVREILRETAVKIDPNNTNATGRWRDEANRISTDPGYTGPFFSQFYGFGRIDVAAAVTAAKDYPSSRDIFVRDNMSDTGAGTSSSPFWHGVDIWVRNNNDGVSPANYSTSANSVHESPIAGQTNWLHVRYKNRGTADSYPFYVRAYITHYASAEFIYPEDFIPTVKPDGTIPSPLTPGTYLIGEQLVNPTAADAEGFVTFEWQADLIPPKKVEVEGVEVEWHPCLLVEVSPHDGFVPTGDHVWDDNNLAQKNLSIVYPDSESDNAILAMLGNVMKEKLKNLKIVIFPEPRIRLPYFICFPDPKINRAFQAFAKRNIPGSKADVYKRARVTWIDSSEKISFEIPNSGLTPMIVGLGKQTKFGEEFELHINQFSGRKITGSCGVQFLRKK